MGIFSRLGDIINSNVTAMLDKAEDPEKMIRLIIQEMEDTLVEVRSTSVRTLARKKEIGRTIDRLRAEAADWEAKAELALSKEREDLARAALTAKTRAEQRVTALEGERDQLDAEIEKLDEDTGKLRAKLADAKQRQNTLVMKRASADSRLKARQQLSHDKLDDAMLRFEQYEGRIDDVEAQIESYDLGSRPSLSEEFEKLEADDRVEAELTRLRNRMASGGSDDSQER